MPTWYVDAMLDFPSMESSKLVSQVDNISTLPV